jgi:hypothetical protein
VPALDDEQPALVVVDECTHTGDPSFGGAGVREHAEKPRRRP